MVYNGNVNKHVIPKEYQEYIVGLHYESGNHHIYNFGKFPELQTEMGHIAYQEISVDGEINDNKNLLLIDPSNETLQNENLTKHVKAMKDGEYFIVVMRDIDPIYEDESLPFFGLLVNEFVLTKTKEIRTKNNKYEGHNHDLKIYCLRKDSTANNIYMTSNLKTKLRQSVHASDREIYVENTEKYNASGFLIIGSEKIRYGIKTDNSFKQLDRGIKGSLPSNHNVGATVAKLTPTKAIQKMPVLLKK